MLILYLFLVISRRITAIMQRIKDMGCDNCGVFAGMAEAWHHCQTFAKSSISTAGAERLGKANGRWNASARRIGCQVRTSPFNLKLIFFTQIQMISIYLNLLLYLDFKNSTKKVKKQKGLNFRTVIWDFVMWFTFWNYIEKT